MLPTLPYQQTNRYAVVYMTSFTYPSLAYGTQLKLTNYMVANMTALNKNGIIRAIPLKVPIMKAAVLEKHNKNLHVLLQQSILLPSLHLESD